MGEEKVKTGRASDEYRDAMLSAMRSNFRNVSNVLQEGVDADGGYLVPEEYDKRLIDILDGENIMRSLGTTITTAGQHKINIAATKPAAAWIEEGGALSFGDATFDQIYSLEKAVKGGGEKNSNIDLLSLEIFENIAYIMAKHADNTIPDTAEEWLDGFNTFSIYRILPSLIELWGLNVQTEIHSKKNFVKPNVK